MILHMVNIITFCFLLQLFDTLVGFFPEDMAQPNGNLVDLML